MLKKIEFLRDKNTKEYYRNGVYFKMNFKKNFSANTITSISPCKPMRGSFHAALKFRINSRFDHYYNPCYIFLFFYFISFDSAYRRKLNFLRQTSYYRNVELILKKDYYYSKLIRAYYIILFFYSRRKKEIIEMLN